MSAERFLPDFAALNPCYLLRPRRSESDRIVASPRNVATAQQAAWHLPFLLRQRLCDFARMLKEKLRDGTERAVLQGEDSDRHEGNRQFNGQDFELRAPGKERQSG